MPRSISSGTWFTATANTVKAPRHTATTSSTNGRLRAIDPALRSAAALVVSAFSTGSGQGPRSPNRVCRDCDGGEHGGEHEVGAAPAERVEHRRGQRREYRAGEPGDQGERGERPDAVAGPPSGSVRGKAGG